MWADVFQGEQVAATLSYVTSNRCVMKASKKIPLTSIVKIQQKHELKTHVLLKLEKKSKVLFSRANTETVSPQYYDFSTSVWQHSQPARDK